jgi:multidrug resistance efflux pump
MRSSMGRSQLEELRRDLVELQGKRDISQASVGVLKSRIDRHLLRAEVTGTVADVAEVRPGAFVHEGQKLGAIVPPGTLKIVAAFAPSALGRLKPGQLGRIRLEGFPWIQFGAVDATVTRVASEVREGSVRVELDPIAGSAPGIPMEHGLPGSLEVIVERASPAWLVFRNVGRYVGDVLPSRRAASP